MTAQAISASSLVCAGQAARARLMRRAPAGTPAGHVTEFLQGMLDRPGASAGQALPKGRLLRVPARDLVVECVSGELWLTRDGDREDYILGPGRKMAVGRRDRAILQALRDSRLRLMPA